MPVTLPVNTAGSLIINARMVGAIAHLRGYDIKDPHTQAVLMLVVAGSGGQAALAELGVTIGKQGAKQAINAVPIAVIRAINKKAGFYLIAKYGTERSAITLAKLVPGVGGIVGGSVDASLTRFIGRQAKKAFAPGTSGTQEDVPYVQPHPKDQDLRNEPADAESEEVVINVLTEEEETVDKVR